MSVEKFKEAYHEYREVVCDDCNTAVDLSEASDLIEAAQVFDDHIDSHE